MMKPWKFALSALLLGLASAGARGQLAPRDSYVGQVTADTLNVRSGPSDDYYVCATLDLGDRITVTGKAQNGWLQIKPVEGCFSAVSKLYVNRQGESTTGTISGDSVRVRAGGDKVPRTTLLNGTNLKTQAFLNKGDRVTILGDLNNGYYKIQPPQGVFWWVSGDHVQRAQNQRAVVVARRPDTTGEADGDQDASQEDENTGSPASGQGGDSATGTSTTPPQKADPTRRKWQEVERALQAEFQKPYAQRDYKSLLARYQGLDIDEDHYLNPWLQTRVEFLNQAIRQRQTLQEVEEMVRQSRAEQQRLKTQRTQMEMAGMEEPAISTYAVEGILMPSEVYTGKGGIPKRYLVYRPGTQRVVAFVQSTSRTVDLDLFTRKHVGIFGSRKFDDHLLLTLVDAMQVKVIDQNPELPEAGRAKAIVPEPLRPVSQESPKPQEPSEPAPSMEDYEMPLPEFDQPEQGEESEGEAVEVESSGTEQSGSEASESSGAAAVEVENVSDQAEQEASGEQTSSNGLPAAPADEDPALNTVDEKEYK